MNIPRYKFIAYPYVCSLGSSTNVKLVHTILDHDVQLHDLLDQFQAFIQAAGYTFMPGDSLQVVNDADDYDRDSFLDLLDRIDSLIEENQSLLSQIDEYAKLPELQGTPV